MSDKYEGLQECLPQPLRSSSIVILEGRKGHATGKQKRRKKPYNKSGDWYKKYVEV